VRGSKQIYKKARGCGGETREVGQGRREAGEGLCSYLVYEVTNLFESTSLSKNSFLLGSHSMADEFNALFSSSVNCYPDSYGRIPKYSHSNRGD
jgi:hypothetical protein